MSTTLRPNALPEWPRALLVDIALNRLVDAALLSSYDLTVDQYVALAADPAFNNDLEAVRAELSGAEGLSFRQKAKSLADDFLADVYRMVKNEDTADNVRADLIKSTVAWSGEGSKGVGAEGGFRLTIVMGERSATIEHE